MRYFWPLSWFAAAGYAGWYNHAHPDRQIVVPFVDAIPAFADPVAAGHASVAILGAGFGGLTFCQHFGHPNARITVVDRTNHHLFQPLLYQVATASLSPGDVASPIRWILRKQANVRVLLADVRGIDVTHRGVLLDAGGDPGNHGSHEHAAPLETLQ